MYECVVQARRWKSWGDLRLEVELPSQEPRPPSGARNTGHCPYNPALTSDILSPFHPSLVEFEDTNIFLNINDQNI
jgi:hypothetical protein